MWARKRPDIGWRDLLYGVAACLWPGDAETALHRLESTWAADDVLLPVTSVRSGFDLLWRATELPPDSEVLISAITVPDMARILQHHALVPAPVDVDPQTAAPRLESLAAALTPQTRAVVVAHLFGSRIDLRPVVEFARRHDLLLIEDCAQAYCGPRYTGHPDADACLFSFGPIKAATALAGGIVRVRDERLAESMRAIQAGDVRQSRRSYCGRLLKYGLLKLLAMRGLYRLFVGGCRAARVDFNTLLNKTVRNYSAADLFGQLRRQPTPPLVQMMARRVANYSLQREQNAVRRGRILVERLQPAVMCPAGAVEPHTFWVFPVLADDPAALIAHLAAAGFDALQSGSMMAVDPPPGRENLRPTAAEELLAHVVYLPFYPQMPDAELLRMADAVLEFTSSAHQRGAATAVSGTTPAKTAARADQNG